MRIGLNRVEMYSISMAVRAQVGVDILRYYSEENFNLAWVKATLQRNVIVKRKLLENLSVWNGS